MENKAVRFCVVVGVLGMISAIVGFVGEGTRVKGSEVSFITLDDGTYCSYPVRPTLSLAILGIVIATVVAVVQFSRAVQGSKHGGYVDSYGVVNCYILKPGIFAVGAILALFSAIFGIAAYVTGIGAPQTTTNPPIVGVPMGANFDLERNAVPNPTPQYPTPQYPPPQYFPPQ
nr:hypothetical protein CTI12_AA551540 [Tanacetum cinerariifolium]